MNLRLSVKCQAFGWYAYINLLPKLIYVFSVMVRWGKTFFHKFREKVKQQKVIFANLVDCVDESSTKRYLVEKDK